MLVSENTISIRFDEVDIMGYVYHGNYSKYYHLGRTELLRKMSISDKELMKSNILMPVLEVNSKFIKPIFYEDKIIIKTNLKEFSRCKMKFHYELFNLNNELVHFADSTIVFVDEKTRKPIRLPKQIMNAIETHIYKGFL